MPGNLHCRSEDKINCRESLRPSLRVRKKNRLRNDHVADRVRRKALRMGSGSTVSHYSQLHSGFQLKWDLSGAERQRHAGLGRKYRTPDHIQHRESNRLGMVPDSAGSRKRIYDDLSVPVYKCVQSSGGWDRFRDPKFRHDSNRLHRRKRRRDRIRRRRRNTNPSQGNGIPNSLAIEFDTFENSWDPHPSTAP